MEICFGDFLPSEMRARFDIVIAWAEDKKRMEDQTEEIYYCVQKDEFQMNDRYGNDVM